MKYFVLLFLLSILAGCAREKQNQAAQKQTPLAVNYGQQLFESGFLDFADTSKSDALKSRLIDSFSIYDESTNKSAHIDAEALAEFNLDFFMPRLTEVLALRNFKLNVKADDYYETTLAVIINGEKTELYTTAELEKNDILEPAARNFFKEVNSQLRNAKIAESLYLLYGGNDLQVMLLTPDQQKIIAAKYKDEVNEIPYLP